jgi:pyroglutamyl-peptidase
MKKLLLTGFEAFAEHSTNPTEKLVNKFSDSIINNYKIKAFILPVEYKAAATIVSELIELEKPDAIISLGLAADRTEITPELIAINYCHSNVPDNAGAIKLFTKINPKSKESFISTLPLESMIKALNEKEIDAKLSTSAGTYVCNTVMYTALQKSSQMNLDIPCGFIHIPNDIEEHQLINALTICISSL